MQGESGRIEETRCLGEDYYLLKIKTQFLQRRTPMKWLLGFFSFACVFVAILGLCSCKKPISESLTPPDITPVEKIVEIHTLYSVNLENCLNSSASHNWAQMTTEGTVGIIYRESLAAPDGSNISRLILKTITPNGMAQNEEITRNPGVENCTLLYNSANQPHVFAVLQNGTAQDLVHFFRNMENSWQSEIVSHFPNSGGEYIMELTAALGPNDSLHLAVLQFGSTPDNYLFAQEDSNLYYINNKNTNWKQELVEHFDTVYILMNIGYWYMRPLRRQDLAIDASGYAHLVYGALVYKGSDPFPTEMRYATNAEGKWKISTALPAPDTSCDAGYNPSLAIDNQGRIAMACTYVERVPAKSAQYAQLIFAELENGQWRQTILADSADGYFGYDGGKFTGAIPHLRYDKQNRPHIIFSDIASSHVGSGSYLNVGQIRYIHYTNQNWEISTLYHQTSPQDFSHINEIHSACLMFSPDANEFQIIAEEFISAGENRTYNLLHINFK
jgi:hypothetical protein